MKNTISIIIKILIVVLAMQIIFMFSSTSQAGFWSDIFKSADDFLNEGKTTAEKGNIAINVGDNATYIELPKDDEIRSVISDIYNIVFPLGVIVTVAVGGVLGIKFMMASAEDKAKVKESMVPYVIGCAVIFGSFAIWQAAIMIFSSIA